ncbi:MAG: hypothetical protein ABIN74_05050 [Ferruginibacter sp.]
MAKVNYNVVMHGVSGQIGDLLTFIQRHGKTYVGKIRKQPSNISPEQQAIRDKFKLAAKFAKSSIKDPAIKALYEERAGGGVTPYNLAIVDYWAAPFIDSINTANYNGAVGSTIEVQATDDTKVTEVTVSIASAAGVVLEEGLAVMNAESETWHYTATAVNASLAGTIIKAIAKDLPGNSTEMEKVL